MKQKELNKEGITKEYLDTLSVKKLGNPVQLQPKDEPVNLIKNMKGFWISINGEIQKDRTNNYLIVTDKEALIGRARYLLNFKDEILNKKIEQEVERLKDLTDKKLDEALDKLRGSLVYAGKIDPVGFEAVVHGIMKGGSDLEVDTQDYQNKVNAAKELVDDNTQKLYNDLLHQKELADSKDYNSLYAFFLQNNVREVASFDRNDPIEMNALIRFFHKDSIENTIMEIKSNDHIYNVAKFNIEKTNNTKIN